MSQDLVMFRPIPETKKYSWNGKPGKPPIAEVTFRHPKEPDSDLCPRYHGRPLNHPPRDLESAARLVVRDIQRWRRLQEFMEYDFASAQETWPWDILMAHRGHTELKYHTGITREVVG